MADNSLQGGADTIRDKDRTGVKTAIAGLDVNIGGATEQLMAAAAAADGAANPTLPAWLSHGLVYNGATWDRMRGDAANGVDVDVTRLPANTQATGLFVRPRKLATYRAVFRAAARPYSLSNVFAAAGRKQFATIHHAATATKTVRLRHVWVEAESSSAGAAYYYDLVRITTAPATGNPAITASSADSSVAAAEATTLALPTTAATEEARPFCSVEQVIGATVATPSTVNPPPGHAYFDLIDIQGSNADDESTLPTVRAGVLEGWAVTVDSSAAATWRGVVVIEFTEE